MTGRAKPATVATAWLAVAGTFAFVAALLVSLFAGCGPPPRGAVTLHIDRKTASPRDASVTIDEQYVGPLAYVAAHGVILPVGEHRVTVEKSGYFPYDALVTADRAPIEINVVLQRIPD